jgi:hypothetical protein
MVLRDRQNTYDVNSNLAPKQNDGKNVWKNEELDPASVGTTDRRYVLFVGDSSSDMAEAVSRWCTYAKWDISKCSSMEKFKENDKNLPGMLILESEKYALDDNLKKIEELEQKGVIIVFGCLEDPKNIEKNQPLIPFKYHNKGSMATIGRNNAVVELRRIRFGGFPAWAVWLFIHLMSIVGVKNRLFIFIDWMWSYFTYDPSLRLIIKPQPSEEEIEEKTFDKEAP